MARKKKRSLPLTSSEDTLQGALDLFAPLLPAGELTLLMNELKKPLLTALRINPLKSDPAQSLPDWINRYGWELKQVPYCPLGYWVEKSETIPSQTIEHLLGHYYIQDAASMLPVELFDFDGLENPLILDMAASPGGKTTHLVSRSGDRGLIVANDSSRDRLTALRIVLSNSGSTCVAVTNYPGERFGQWYPETFDRILLDAPCSMQSLRSTDSHPMRPITNREKQSLAQRQTRLLASAFQTLKIGGQVVYSTCTLTSDEDEGVLDALIKLYPAAVQIDRLDAHLPYPAPGLLNDAQRSFHPSVENAARLWPHRYGTSGFFAARITKLQSVPSRPVTPPARPLEQAGWFPLAPNRANHLTAELRDSYGFDLAELLQSARLSLWEHNQSLFVFPDAFLEHFAGLPVQALGLLLGENSPDGIQLSQEWITRFGRQFKQGIIQIEADQLSPWLAGEDLQISGFDETLNNKMVWVCDADQRSLGRGKLSGGKLKNLLPRR